MCARRRSNFLLSRQEKVTKEKATLLCVSLRCATGNLRCSVRGCAAELTARWRAPLKQLRRVSARSACVLRHTHAPPALRFSARTEGNPQPDNHTGHCCARPGWRRRCAPRTRGRAQRWPVWLALPNPLLAAPAAGCLWGGMRVGALMLRELTRRVCPNGGPKARSELCGAPRKHPDTGLPRRGRRLRGAILCLLSCRATRKEVARRGESRPSPSKKAHHQLQKQ